MKHVYTEFTCDNCGMSEHFHYPHSDEVAKKMGWIIISKDEHYCTERCYNQSKGNFYEKA